MDFAFLGETLLRLLSAVPTTLELAFVSVSIGLGLALLLALLRASSIIGAGFVRAYVFVFRGSPLLVQIFLIYYGLGQFDIIRESVLWPFLRRPWWCAILALALNTAAYGSEIIRGGLAAVPAGSVEAGRVAGMSRFTLYRRIILPLALRQALPAYGSEVIIMVKSTSLASIITITELTGTARQIVSDSFRAIEVFVCAGLIYLAINFLLTRVVVLLERSLSPHLRGVPR
jgi:octopine/nopaline transport system permease protein